MNTVELTCIRCPLGCPIRVELVGSAVKSVSGNSCARGEKYARSEAVAPVRTVTSSVRVSGGERPVVSVKTVPEVPKGSIAAVMEAVRRLHVAAPVEQGAVLLADVAGTGSNLIATAAVAAE